MISPAGIGTERMNDKKSNLKWPVSAAQDIAAPKEAVWRVISTPGNLESCHPFCRRNPVQAWDGAQSRDEVHYLNGRIFERRFREWHEGVGYDLDIYERERQRAAVSWRIDETGPDSCRLTITARPRLPGKWPVLVQWFAALPVPWPHDRRVSTDRRPGTAMRTQTLDPRPQTLVSKPQTPDPTG